MTKRLDGQYGKFSLIFDYTKFNGKYLVQFLRTAEVSGIEYNVRDNKFYKTEAGAIRAAKSYLKIK